MRIEGLGALLPRLLVSGVQRAPTTATLSREQAPTPDQALHPNPLANPAIGSVQMLVAMSAQSPIEERRRKAAQTAARGLDALATLEAAAILGSATAAETKTLEDWSQALAETPPDTGDPALDALLADIDLRVRVELAKLDREV